MSHTEGSLARTAAYVYGQVVVDAEGDVIMGGCEETNSVAAELASGSDRCADDVASTVQYSDSCESFLSEARSGQNIDRGLYKDEVELLRVFCSNYEGYLIVLKDRNDKLADLYFIEYLRLFNTILNKFI